jgi:hypothetical protein
MHVDLAADHRLAPEVARAFVEKEIEPRAAESDRADEVPPDLYRRMGATRRSSSVSTVTRPSPRSGRRSVISRRLLG